MSPSRVSTLMARDSFPRVSGDEPMKDTILNDALGFSPRERG